SRYSMAPAFLLAPARDPAKRSIPSLIRQAVLPAVKHRSGTPTPSSKEDAMTVLSLVFKRCPTRLRSRRACWTRWPRPPPTTCLGAHDCAGGFLGACIRVVPRKTVATRVVPPCGEPVSRTCGSHLEAALARTGGGAVCTGTPVRTGVGNGPGRTA